MNENENNKKHGIFGFPIDDIVEALKSGVMDKETKAKIHDYWHNTYWKALEQIDAGKLSAYPDPESARKLTPDEAFRLYVLFKLCFTDNILDQLDFLAEQVIQVEKRLDEIWAVLEDMKFREMLRQASK